MQLPQRLFSYTFDQSMNYYAFTALLNAIFATLAGSAVLIQNPKRKKNIIFFSSALSVALWCYFYTLWQMADSASSALFWVRLQMMACAFVPVTAYHQVLTLFEDTNKRRRQFLILLYATAVVISAFGFSPYFIKGVEPRLEFPFWPIPSFFIHILFLTLPIPIFFALRLIKEEKSRSSPLIQNQLKWLSLAIAIGYGGGCTNCPLWYNIPLRPYLNFTVALYFPVAALIFFKLGVVDMKYFLSRFGIYLLTVGLFFIPFMSVAYFLDQNWRILALIAAMAFFVPLAFPLFHDWIKQKFLRTTHSQEAMEARIEKIKETTYTYDDLAQNIVNSLLNTFPVEMAAVYFYDLNRKDFSLRAQRGMKNKAVESLKYNRSTLAIPEEDPLISFLLKQPSAVSLDEVQNDSEKIYLVQPIISSLKRIEADVCAPFIFDKKIKGLLVLGRKKDNALFNKEDMDAVEAFSKMGEEIMRYIFGMETELRNTSLYSHDMAHDARSLIQTLEFISSPMAEKQPREKIIRLMDQAKTVAIRLNDIFQMNRDRSNLILRSVRGEYEKIPVDIIKAVRLATEKYVLLAEKQNIELSADIPNASLTILGNELDLMRVVDNILSNGLRYVSAGGHIKVKAGPADDMFKIEIIDDGTGIDPENLNRIWEMGWQGKDNKGAGGLGLSIVKQIVEMHHGTIQAQSEGLGKGTRFNISLPLNL